MADKILNKLLKSFWDPQIFDLFLQFNLTYTLMCQIR